MSPPVVHFVVCVTAPNFWAFLHSFVRRRPNFLAFLRSFSMYGFRDIYFPFSPGGGDDGKNILHTPAVILLFIAKAKIGFCFLIRLYLPLSLTLQYTLLNDKIAPTFSQLLLIDFV